VGSGTPFMIAHSGLISQLRSPQQIEINEFAHELGHAYRIRAVTSFVSTELADYVNPNWGAEICPSRSSVDNLQTE
jgi:hypothetical protein